MTYNKNRDKRSGQFTTHQKVKQAKKTRRSKRLLKLILVLLIVAVGSVIYTQHQAIMDLLDNEVSYETQIANVFQKEECDDICTKQKNVRKMVEAAIEKKEIVNNARELRERAEAAYIETVDMENEAIRNYNLTLDALGLYGSGSIDIFFEVATERGLFASSTIENHGK